MDNNVEKVDLDRVDWKSSREFFESLGEALDRMDDKSESYNFTWVGKRKSIVEAGAPINKILRPDIEASKDFDNTKNMLIVGDNLDALKLLQESYLGKIKMIYIDPPYNTGHDFVYHDNFTVKKADFKDDSTDSDGNVIISEDEYAENSKANGRFHSDWLSMMYPRLKLSKNLLADDGVIFISIGDEEIHNCRKICDEVFGEDNYIGTFVVENNPKGRKNGKFISVTNDYCAVYAKNIDVAEFKKTIPKHADDMVEDENGDFVRRSGKRVLMGENTLNKKVKNFSSEKHFSAYIREDDIVFKQESSIDDKDETLLSSGFRRYITYDGSEFVENTYTKSKFKELFDNKALDIRDDKIYEKHFSDNMQIKSVLVNNEYDAISNNKKIQYIIDLKSTSAKQALSNLMGGDYFSFPKNVSFIEHLLSLHYDKNAYILDFFSGSGTTGHAVMDLNAEDGGKRQYICVQLDEKTDEKSEAKKAGYDTIDQITAERLRRAGEKIKSEHPDAHIDTGFRVFRVDGSNENEGIRKPLNQINQSDLFGAIDNIKKDRTPLDLLFGVIYASALPFDLKLETRKIGDNTVYLYGYLDEGTGLVACFDEKISEETVREIAKLKALTAAFKDSSFTNSAAKINLSEHFRIVCPDTKVKVI